jgi:hypothetical protein
LVGAVRRYDEWAENEKATETIMTRNNHEGEREEGEGEEGESEEAGRTGQSQSFLTRWFRRGKADRRGSRRKLT